MQKTNFRPVVHYLGITDYIHTLNSMQDFTANRSADTSDEIWITEHKPVYTLGLSREGVKLPTRFDIPVVATDRGGKITYHGPGQLVMYLLLDLNRLNLNVNLLVSHIEDAILQLLNFYNIEAGLIKGVPGVYVGAQKIASLGLRVRKGYSYHGLSLNVSMDLSPFSAIDPCGVKGLVMTQLNDLGISATMDVMSEQLSHYLINKLVSVS